VSRPFLAFVLGAWLVATPAQAQDQDRAAEPAEQERGAHRIPEGVRVPAWNELGEQQREQLAPLAEQWDQLPASRRVRALERLDRRERWESMTPEQREKLRKGARNFRDLPPELREKMRTSMQAMRELPEAERKQLWEIWRSRSPEQRRAWLEAGGPGLAPPPED
jgi:hypothetical protein